MMLALAPVSTMAAATIGLGIGVLAACMAASAARLTVTTTSTLGPRPSRSAICTVNDGMSQPWYPRHDEQRRLHRHDALDEKRDVAEPFVAGGDRVRLRLVDTSYRAPPDQSEFALGNS